MNYSSRNGYAFVYINLSIKIDEVNLFLTQFECERRNIHCAFGNAWHFHHSHSFWLSFPLCAYEIKNVYWDSESVRAILWSDFLILLCFVLWILSSSYIRPIDVWCGWLNSLFTMKFIHLTFLNNRLAIWNWLYSLDYVITRMS